MTKIRNKRKLRIFDVINACIMILLGFSFVVPFWIIACSSLSDNGQLMSKGISLWFRGFSFEGYAFLFQMSDVFFKSIISSLIVSFSNAALSVALCTGAAYVLAKKDLAGRKALNIFFMIPMFFGGGLIATYVTYANLHILNTFWVYILPCAFNFFNMVVVRTYLQTIPDSLCESARIDGGTELQIVWRIMLPLSMPIVATIILWNAVFYWNDWTTTLYYITNPNLYTLQYNLEQILKESERSASLIQQAQQSGRPFGSITSDMTPEAIQAAQIIISTLPIIVVYPFLQKYFVQGVTLGSVKE